MRLRISLRAVGATYLAALAVAGVAGYVVGAGHAIDATFVASTWEGGELVHRAIEPTKERLDAQKARSTPGVVEKAVRVGTVLPGVIGSLSFAPGRDGARFRQAASEEWVYLTPSDLLSAQVYDRGQGTSVGLTFGVDFKRMQALAEARAGKALSATVTWERVRFETISSEADQGSRAIDASPAAARERAFAAADYLVRATKDDGTFRYEVRATGGDDAQDYNWVRHAGTVWFLARAARISKVPGERAAAIRAARALESHALQSCGEHACITQEANTADLGGSALGLLALSEVDRNESAPLFGDTSRKLAAFLRAAQKPNGDFAHVYDRKANSFVSRFRMYYTGEAGLALARYGETEAAAKALSYLANESWAFPGNRYYVSEEHWTCLLLEALWDKRPSEEGLRFCLNWAAVIRAQLVREGQGPSEDLGTFRVSPVMAPRLTPVASRTEALLAILAVLSRSNRLPAEREKLMTDVQATLRALAQYQYGARSPLPHVARNEALLAGGIPASRTLWDVRIDSVQHAGSAFLNFAAMREGVPFAER